VVSLSQGRTAAAQCGLFTHKSVPVIFEPPCITVPKIGTKNYMDKFVLINICSVQQPLHFKINYNFIF